MELRKQKAEFLGQTPTDRRQMLMFLERVGRICYKSEDAITGTSAPEFCEKKFGVGHFSIFDHSNIVFEVPIGNAFAFHRSLMFLPRRAGYHNYSDCDNGKMFVNGNARAWEETLRLLLARVIEFKSSGVALAEEIIVCLFCAQLMKYLPQIFKFDLHEVSNHLMYENPGIKLITDQTKIPTSLKMYSSFWVTDRSVTHELVRHRPCAFMQESQRYVTYESGVTCIIPPLVNLPEGDYEYGQNEFHRKAPFYNGKLINSAGNELRWLCAMLDDEIAYRGLLKDKEHNPHGWAPQHARDPLSNSCKTEIMVTADLAEWAHIFNMRCPSTAHPKIREMAISTLEQFSQNDEIVGSGLLTEQFEKFLGCNI